MGLLAYWGGEVMFIFYLLPLNHLTTIGQYMLGPAGLTPIEANNIDVKIDGGNPETGAVLAQSITAPPTIPGFTNTPAGRIGGSPPSAAATSTSNTCVIGTGTNVADTYNRVQSTGGNDPSCGLSIKFQ
jgi:hypothetical protein